MRPIRFETTEPQISALSLRQSSPCRIKPTFAAVSLEIPGDRHSPVAKIWLTRQNTIHIVGRWFRTCYTWRAQMTFPWCLPVLHAIASRRPHVLSPAAVARHTDWLNDQEDQSRRRREQAAREASAQQIRSICTRYKLATPEYLIQQILNKTDNRPQSNRRERRTVLIGSCIAMEMQKGK